MAGSAGYPLTDCDQRCIYRHQEKLHEKTINEGEYKIDQQHEQAEFDYLAVIPLSEGDEDIFELIILLSVGTCKISENTDADRIDYKDRNQQNDEKHRKYPEQDPRGIEECRRKHQQHCHGKHCHIDQNECQNSIPERLPMKPGSIPLICRLVFEHKATSS